MASGVRKSVYRGLTELRVVVVEDEAVVARRLLRLLRKILGTDLTEIVHLNTLRRALHYVEDHEIDVVFLDLDLGGNDGFDLLRDSVSRPFHTIVVSARHDQALRAFEYGVLDFVPKPYDESRLQRALDRLQADVSSTTGQARYLAVRKLGEILQIEISTVSYIRGAGDYSELHCADGGGVHLHQKSLTELMRILPKGFVRIHRSYIVDWNQIEALKSEEGSRYFVRLKDGERLPVSRNTVKQLRDSWR